MPLIFSTAAALLRPLGFFGCAASSVPIHRQARAVLPPFGLVQESQRAQELCANLPMLGGACWMGVLH